MVKTKAFAYSTNRRGANQRG
eukprot:COSAG04_NODE_3946_length_2405_cov_66.168690_3_plen_20_part_01